MGRGKKPTPIPFLSPTSSSSSPSSSKRCRSVRRLPSLPRPPLVPPVPVTGKHRKKASSTRLWMRLDRRGGCELLMCDKAFVARRSGVPARDLRVLGPLLSRSVSILAREKAMVINLEFVRAIVTADEVLLLEPLAQEVLPFVEKLRRQFPLKSLEVDVGAGHLDNKDGKLAAHAPCVNEAVGAVCELPFEFQVVDLALEAACLSFNSTVSDLNTCSISVLDDLTNNVSTRNLERIRSLKSSLTCLLVGVQKVRDEVEHLLDDTESMTLLYLSRKRTKSQKDEALMASVASNGNFPSETSLARPNSSIQQSMGIATNAPLDSDMENLEILLEAYFMQPNGIRNRILLVRRHIVDTEDYVNIQLDSKRNELIRLQLTLTIASFGIAINTFIVASFVMNIPLNGGHLAAGGPYGLFVGSTSSFCMLVVVMLFGYAWRNGILRS